MNLCALVSKRVNRDLIWLVNKTTHIDTNEMHIDNLIYNVINLERNNQSHMK
jgi:hypothetical protein